MNRLLALLAAAAMLFVAHPNAQDAQSTAAPRPGAKAAQPATVVNLNTATIAELDKLPGIGPAVAARIIEYRQKKGPFKKIEELMNVQGIGEKSFLQLRSQITVGAAPEVAARQQ
jgi:competence protein ComEA